MNYYQDIIDWFLVYPKWLYVLMTLNAFISTVMSVSGARGLSILRFVFILFNVISASQYFILKKGALSAGFIMDFISCYLFLPPTGLVFFVALGMLLWSSSLQNRFSPVLTLFIVMVLSVIHAALSGFIIEIDQIAR